MKDLISEYLEDHKTAWAESTLLSEKRRLNSVADHLNKTPEELYKYVKAKGLKPYTIKTLFIRLSDLDSWAAIHKGLPERGYRRFIEKHANRFKHAYQKEEIQITFEDACMRISQLEEPYQTVALSMLKTGLRISEIYNVKDGKVLGKGGKVRSVFGTIEVTVPRSTLSRKLKAVGLKPHTLRKLCASRLADKGATPADLCKVFGWSSITTAYQYLQAKDDARLEALVEESTKGL